MEAADDAVVLFDFHEGLQVDIGDAGGLFLQGKEQVQILLPVPAAADFPQPFADGRDGVQQPEIIAERAVRVAFVGLPYRAEPGARQAAPAAGGKRSSGPTQRAGPQAFQSGNFRQQIVKPLFRGQLNLAEDRQGNLLLPGPQGLILRQGGKEPEPGQGVLF